MENKPRSLQNEPASFVANLFKQKSLVDVQNVRQKLCMDAEKQREELRIIVGERYQELISAADTFKLMQQSSEKILQGLEKCGNLCSSLVAADVGSTESSPARSRLKLDENSIASLAVVRWVMELIPQIWRCIEARRFPLAVKKYLQCQAALEDKQMREAASEKARQLAKRLLSTLTAVPQTVKSKVLEVLAETSLETAVAQECLLALIILERLPLSNTLAMLLATRSEALKKLCKKTVTFSAFKNALSEWEVFVISTLSSVEHTFAAGSLDGHMFSPVEFDDTLCESNQVIEKYIPEHLRNYQVPLQLKCDLTPADVESALQEWRSETKLQIAGVLHPFYRSVSSVRSCSQLQQLAFQKLSLTTDRVSPFWQEYFWPVVRVRMDELIVKGMNEACELCLGSLRLEIETSAMSSDDYLQWMWSESAENAHQVALLSHTNDLALKSRGIPTQVRSAFQILDERVGKVISEVDYYIKHIDPSETEFYELQQIVRCRALEGIENCLNQEFRHLQYGKFLFSIAELKGALYTALSYGSPNSHVWADLKAKLYLAYETQLNWWIEEIINQFRTVLTSKLSELIESGPTSLSLRWDSLDVDSTATRIPCGISLPFQESLDIMEDQVFMTGGHTLGRNAINRLTWLLGTTVLDTYDMIARTPKLNQTLALQFYFDIQFSLALLLRRESKELQVRAADLLLQLEHHIDPVDLGVLSSHWSDQVAAAVSIQKLLYHCITPFEKAGIQKVKMNPVASGNHLRIATATTCSRFSALPVIARADKTEVNGGEEKKMIPVTSATVSKIGAREASPISTTSRSFLGAMSSSWFGAK